MKQTDHGLVPEGEGWFVLNAREAKWQHTENLGSYLPFEGDVRFPELGINLNWLAPGQPMAMYHEEDRQEDFLVLLGEALLIVEGEERPLRTWDFVHCPALTPHVIVGAGEAPCLVLAAGARRPGDHKLRYPWDEAALRHGAGSAQETSSPAEAYGNVELVDGPCPSGFPRQGLG